MCSGEVPPFFMKVDGGLLWRCFILESWPWHVRCKQSSYTFSQSNSTAENKTRILLKGKTRVSPPFFVSFHLFSNEVEELESLKKGLKERGGGGTLLLMSLRSSDSRERRYGGIKKKEEKCAWTEEESLQLRSLTIWFKQIPGSPEAPSRWMNSLQPFSRGITF